MAEREPHLSASENRDLTGTAQMRNQLTFFVNNVFAFNENFAGVISSYILP